MLGAAEKTLEVSFGPVQELVQAKCAACHEWPGSVEGVLGVVKPGDPAESPMWKMVSADLMPPDEPLADAEKTLLQDWIAAGAPTDATAADATTGATTDEAEAPADAVDIPRVQEQDRVPHGLGLHLERPVPRRRHRRRGAVGDA